MTGVVQQFQELLKGVDHKKSIPSAAVAAPKVEALPEPHPDLAAKVKYGGLGKDSIGELKHDGHDIVVRHGAAAARTNAQHKMAKLLGADHMLPDQTYDAGIHHQKAYATDKFDHHAHAGTSFQRKHSGTSVDEGAEKREHPQAMRDQWKSGDLHKLWALHYIANDVDTHGGNFTVDKTGVKYYDADHSFFELPWKHAAAKEKNGDVKTYGMGAPPLPSYVKPFVADKDHEGNDMDKDDWEGIDPIHKKDQVHTAALNSHAGMIKPELFAEFGPFAHERAERAKAALSSSDPTGEMMKLWKDKSIQGGKVEEPKKPKSEKKK